MKIRTGFVSNSSSSSYVVLIDIEKADFLDLLGEEFWHLRKDEFVQGIERDIEKHRTDLKNEKDSKSVLKSFYRSYIKQNQETLAALSKLKKESQVTEFILEKKGVSISDQNWMLELKSHSTMHNDFGDVPEMMKDILTYLLFQRPETKITCRQEDYDNGMEVADENPNRLRFQ